MWKLKRTKKERQELRLSAAEIKRHIEMYEGETENLKGKHEIEDVFDSMSIQFREIRGEIN